MNYIFRNENALYYECGYSNDNAIFVNLKSDRWLITDSRYTVEAREKVKDAEVIEATDLLNAVRSILRHRGVNRVVFDPKEWSVQAIEGLRSRLPHIRFVPKIDLSHRKRIIKRAEEIEFLKRAAELGREGFEQFAEYLNLSGLDRREKRLNFEMKAAMSRYGEFELSFDPIVAIGANAAKPHAIPGEIVLKEGDLLLVDAGVKYCRYCSDRTRTVYFKEGVRFHNEQRFKSLKTQKAYDLVRSAHDRAIENLRSGMTGAQVDRLAREVIEKGGMGEFFVHSTGHGVGLDIHEMPYISARSNTIIEDGMVFTIEPGIYIPEEFGIRIEDMVVISNGRAEIL